MARRRRRENGSAVAKAATNRKKNVSLVIHKGEPRIATLALSLKGNGRCEGSVSLDGSQTNVKVNGEYKFACVHFSLFVQWKKERNRDHHQDTNSRVKRNP